jgi:hypothetical protein
MKTTVTNQQVISLINRAFNVDGFLVNPKSKKNQKEAIAFLESEVSVYGQTVNGFDAHTCLLIIAYPNSAI